MYTKNFSFAFNTTNLSMLIINNNLELVRILDNTNFDEFELTDMPMEQPHESPHKLMGVGMAPTSDTLRTLELVPRNRSSNVLYSGVDLCQGSSLSRFPYATTTKQHSPIHCQLHSLKFVPRGRYHLLRYVTVSMVTTTRKVPGTPRCP